MTLVQNAPWIDQLAELISEDHPSQSREELATLCRDLEIAVTMADSLVECSNELQEIARKWKEKYGPFKKNCSDLHP